MPEGDTLVRTADGLRPHLVGRPVTAASARQPGPQAERLVGATVTAVEAAGKNLLIRFDNGLEVRTHLRMHGSWHRYRPASAGAGPRHVPGSCSRCRARSRCASMPRSRALRTAGGRPAPGPLAPRPGPADGPDVDTPEAVRRLRDPSARPAPSARRCSTSVRLAGIGNEVRNEAALGGRPLAVGAVRGVDDDMLRPGRVGPGDPARGRGHRPASRPRLPSHGPSVPPVRDDRAHGAPGCGAAPTDLLVSELPGAEPPGDQRGLCSGRRPASRRPGWSLARTALCPPCPSAGSRSSSRPSSSRGSWCSATPILDPAVPFPLDQSPVRSPSSPSAL